MGRRTQSPRTFIQSSRGRKDVTSRQPNLRVLGSSLINQMGKMTAGMVLDVLPRMQGVYINTYELELDIRQLR